MHAGVQYSESDHSLTSSHNGAHTVRTRKYIRLVICAQQRILRPKQCGCVLLGTTTLKEEERITACSLEFPNRVVFGSLTQGLSIYMIRGVAQTPEKLSGNASEIYIRPIHLPSLAGIRTREVAYSQFISLLKRTEGGRSEQSDLLKSSQDGNEP